MKTRFLALIWVLSEVAAKKYESFYDQPGMRYYYSYHPYKEYSRSLKESYKRSLNESAPQIVNLVFKGESQNLVNCTHDSLTKCLHCVGPLTELNCTSIFDFKQLENIYLETLALGQLSLSKFGVSSQYVKFKMNPFIKKESNRTTIVYDYIIPIYGYGIDVYVNVTQQPNKTEAENEPKLLSETEYICFNELISILNESKFFYNMRVVSEAINQTFQKLIF
ncbi:hypothetical protein BpHYR1_006741 [Brachionus plicatilis]|uniref:Uncharacterized protein n=1 Tax=Brachionus plicatilis TaxID=10195 RepID=A0A3M7RLA0_BRAPC|nr:hypothetical protein BpHYR1_006741 [Brachionus plicatilis]